jgi:dTDP-4-amino-4,6-dideoxygalactose transaminase
VVEKLALHGGPKAKTVPYSSRNMFGEEEKAQLSEALDQGTLFYAGGRKVAEFCARFARRHEIAHCVPCSSCTGAIQIALSACGVRPGDEVITAPVTDAGTAIGILMCGAIPVFADIDAHNYTLDPAAVEALVGPRTAAILAVHLTGAACDMDALTAIAEKHDLWLVEDCAQSYLAEFGGRTCGTIGDIGCFSLNDFKHISAGDAGMVTTDDDELARRARLFADKCYDRTVPRGERKPHFLAGNWRMSELQGAVALAQLGKLDGIIEGYRRYGDGLHAGLAGLEGLRPQAFLPGSRPSYWYYLARIDEEVLGPRSELVAALAAEGVSATAYENRVVYRWPLLAGKRGLGGTDFPFRLAPEVEYSPGMCPNAEAIDTDAVMLSVSDQYSDQDLEETLAGVRKVVGHFAGRGARR